MKAIKVALLLITSLSLLLTGCGESFRSSEGIKLDFPRDRDAQGNKPTVSATFRNEYKYPTGVAVRGHDYIMIDPGDSLVVKCKTYERLDYNIIAEMDVGLSSEQRRIRIERSGLFTYPQTIVMNESFIRGKCEVIGIITNNRGWEITFWHSQSKKRWVLKPGQSTEIITILSIPTTFHWEITDTNYNWSGLSTRKSRPTYSAPANINQRADYYWEGEWLYWRFSLND